MNKKQKFIQLGWELIKHKILYYEFNKPIIEDIQFDKMEAEYRQLARELKLPPTASDMVGVDLSRPSVQNVLHKIRGGDHNNIDYFYPLKGNKDESKKTKRNSRKIRRRSGNSN
jgi:NAD-dependent DNA ligase